MTNYFLMMVPWVMQLRFVGGVATFARTRPSGHFCWPPVGRNYWPLTLVPAGTPSLPQIKVSDGSDQILVPDSAQGGLRRFTPPVERGLGDLQCLAQPH